MRAADDFRSAAASIKRGKSMRFARPLVLGLVHTAEQALEEAEAENFGLRMTLDEAMGRNVQYVLSGHLESAKADLAGEKPGQVVRTTDTRETWVLNDDHDWEREVGN